MDGAAVASADGVDALRRGTLPSSGAAFIPIGVLSPVGGAPADRLDRRRWLIATTLAETVFAALLALLAATGHAPSWALVVVAFGGRVAAAVGLPKFSQDHIDQRDFDWSLTGSHVLPGSFVIQYRRIKPPTP